MTEHYDKPYIQHILEAIKDIEESTKDISKEEFLDNKDIRDANIRRIEVIGEAVKNISKDFRENHKEILWSKISGTRDKIIHRYFEVDLDTVWMIIEEDISDLKKKLMKILKEI
ncbi:MAG: DUF86 domain-containing protein [Nanoarchaeota archaeon]|nr:DUF86 domain-containing protein [Nanoarchaeota archaeon]